MDLLLLFLLLIVTPISAECPRHKSSISDYDGAAFSKGDYGKSEKSKAGASPAAVPTETTISCTYMHNDKSDTDHHFSDDLYNLLNELVDRLHRHLRVNLQLKKIDCTKRDNVKCGEYSLRESFHWLFIEDSSHGAAVYELSSKLNTKRAIIEVSLLDALSRHSVHDLTAFCSDEAEKEVGFVRRLSDKELNARKLRMKRTLIRRSPLELDLIERVLLEARSFDKQYDWYRLAKLDEKSLSTAVQSNNFTFVLFWNKANRISEYAFYLWSQASKTLVDRFHATTFGAVSCDVHVQICDHYHHWSKSNKFYSTIYSLNTNGIIGRNEELRDVQYYIEWVVLMMNGPAEELQSDAELMDVKRGHLHSFDGIRPAIAVGIFKDIETLAAKVFLEVAESLRGRYHFVYYIKTEFSDRIFIIRSKEKKKRFDYNGVMDVNSLKEFVIQWSLPNVIDITNGFTSDLIIHQHQLVITLMSTIDEARSNFQKMCAKTPTIICTEITNFKSKEIIDFMQSLEMKIDDNDEKSKFVIFIREKIFAVDVDNVNSDLKLINIMAVVAANSKKLTIGADDVNPLRYLQIGRINQVFGSQQISIPTEATIIQQTIRDNVDADSSDDGDDTEYGGCPVMSRLKKANDEL